MIIDVENAQVSHGKRMGSGLRRLFGNDFWLSGRMLHGATRTGVFRARHKAFRPHGAVLFRQVEVGRFEEDSLS